MVWLRLGGDQKGERGALVARAGLVLTGCSHPSGFTLIFHSLFGVGNSPFHEAHRLVHVVLYTVNHGSLAEENREGESRRVQQKKAEENERERERKKETAKGPLGEIRTGGICRTHLARLVLVFQGLFGFLARFLYMVYCVHHVQLYVIYNLALWRGTEREIHTHVKELEISKCPMTRKGGSLSHIHSGTVAATHSFPDMIFHHAHRTPTRAQPYPGEVGGGIPSDPAIPPFPSPEERGEIGLQGHSSTGEALGSLHWSSLGLSRGKGHTHHYPTHTPSPRQCIVGKNRKGALERDRKASSI